MPPIKLIGPYDEARSVNLSNERTVNLMPEINGDQVMLVNTPGLENFVYFGAAPMRGLYVISKDETKLFAISGQKFYRVATDGTAYHKGSLVSSSGLVSISDNGLQLLIVDGTDKGYTYTLATDTFAQIADADFPGGVHAAFLDGYFLSVDPNSEKVRCSARYDGTSWNALDVAPIEGDPDNLVAVVSNKKQLALIGRLSTEFYYNAALPTGLPFLRISGAVVPVGIGATRSLATLGDDIFYAGRTSKGERLIMMNSTKISTPALDVALGKFTIYEDAEGFCYMQDGHPCYVITFPSEKRTFVFDLSMPPGLQWHERRSIVGGTDTRWRARCHTFFNGWHIVGDYNEGRIYKMKMNVYSENGQYVNRKRRFPIMPREGTGFIDILTIDMETGVGYASGVGTDPIMALKLSRDGGHTWGGDKNASIGKIGESGLRVKYRQLGRAVKGMWGEIIISDPVPIRIFGARVNEFD